MRFIKSNIILNTINNLLIYPAPATLTYLWNFGVLAFFCLIIQIISGIFLAMHYIPHIDLAFLSIEHIMRDVNNGWLLRYVHSNGASMFFLVVYIHLFRGLYYGSYLKPKTLTWILGVLILFIMIATAFMGYVLPWGQMSFWAATVITNLASAIPIIGNDIVFWLWGGFSVDNPTLNRFFSFHYLLPFVLLGLVILHIIFLHEHGSSSPLGVNKNHDLIAFHPYFTIKDIFGIIIFLIFFSYFIFFNPNDRAYTFEWKMEGDRMQVTLIGPPFIYQYALKTDPIEYYDPKTIVQYSALLKPNEKRIKEEGKKGMLIRLYKEVYDRNRTLVETVLVSEDFYPPIHRVEVRGLRSETSETPNESPNESPASNESSTPNETPSTELTEQEDIWGNENEQIKGNEDETS